MLYNELEPPLELPLFDSSDGRSFQRRMAVKTCAASARPPAA